MSSVRAISKGLQEMGDTLDKLPCRNTFDMTVHIVIAAVKEHLAKGHLDEHMLDEIEAALTSVDNDQVEAFCHSVHERCMSTYQLDLAVPPRTNAFGRIMVQPLEKLLDRKHRRLSTKQLPNYFKMLSTILGRERYEHLHDHIAELMTNEIRDHGSHFMWGEFYHHHEVVKVRLETLYAIAHAFSHFDTRMEWFITTMEAMVTQDDGSQNTMPFTHTQARDFLLALFDEFIMKKTDENAYQKEILTDAQRQEIAHLIAKLEQM